MIDIQRNIDVVILAGGLGTRLQTVLINKPKVLADICGRPFIFFLLDQLCKAGIGKVVICSGHMGENLETVIGTGYKSLHIDFSRERMLLGTGGALRQAVDIVRREWILVLNGDSYVDIDLQGFVAWHAKIGAKISLVVTSVEENSRYGSVDLSLDGEIQRFVEKCSLAEKNMDGNSKLISAGVYLMHNSVIKSFPGGTKLSLEEEILPSQVGRGFFGYKTTGAFIDIGTPESLLSAPEFFEAIQADSKRST